MIQLASSSQQQHEMNSPVLYTMVAFELASFSLASVVPPPFSPVPAPLESIFRVAYDFEHVGKAGGTNRNFTVFFLFSRKHKPSPHTKYCSSLDHHVAVGWLYQPFVPLTCYLHASEQFVVDKFYTDDIMVTSAIGPGLQQTIRGASKQFQA